MAEITGSIYSWGASADGSQEVTIPSDAAGMVVIVVGLNGTIPNAVLLGALDFEGDSGYDFASVISAYRSGALANTTIVVNRMFSGYSKWPGPGTHTIYYEAYSEDYAEGYYFIAFSVTNIDSASFIVDDWSSISAPSPQTSALVGVGASDLTIGVGWALDPATVDAVPATYGQTLIDNGSHNTANVSCGYEVGEDAYRIEGSGNIVALAFALADGSEAGGGNPIGAIINVDYNRQGS